MWSGLIKNDRIWCEIEDYEILMAEAYKEHLQKAKDLLEQQSVCVWQKCIKGRANSWVMHPPKNIHYNALSENWSPFCE